VTRYLQLLASTRNQGLRHLTIEDNGTGNARLRVSYISEVPIWKSTTGFVHGAEGWRAFHSADGRRAGLVVVDNRLGRLEQCATLADCGRAAELH